MRSDVVQQRREVLLIALTAKASQQRLTEPALSEQLGVSEEYLLELLLGIQPVEDISTDVAQSMAAYLGWPVVVVLMAAGKLRLEDFFTPDSLGKTVADARARWPQLQTASELCAVLALVLTDEEVLSASYLRQVIAEGPLQQA